MKRRGKLRFNIEFLEHVFMFGLLFSIFPSLVMSQSDDGLYDIRPDAMEHYKIPYPYYGIGYLNSDPFMLGRESIMKRNPAQLPVDKVFQIEPSDAIDGIKYSQPDIAHSLFNFKDNAEVPLTNSKHHISRVNPHNLRPDDQRFPNHELSDRNVMKHLRDIRYLDNNEKVDKDNPESMLANNLKEVLPTDTYDKSTTDVFVQNKNNFTDANENLVSVSSDTVLSYVPSDFNHDSENSSVRLHSEVANGVPSLNFSIYNESSFKPQPGPDTTDSSVSLNTHVYVEVMNQTNFTDITIISTNMFPSMDFEENVTNSLPSVDSNKKLSSGTVAGIVIVVLISVTLLSSAVIYLLYRKFNGRCTSVVESKFTTDNCGYLDDSLRSSIYLNNHIELPKESSEEMTSLDNDSFLNSLETMTIQNYWADNSKNTKV